jgi:endonuclease/exonuclease/phosphatase family metal-dependent hydrolase
VARLFPYLAALILPLVAGATTDEIVVAAYNVRNYGVIERLDENGDYKPAPKPAAEVAALINIIKQIQPDILGICEMGAREQLDDLRERLAKAGLKYAHSEFVEAADAERHLALLSRYPIVKSQSLTNVPFELNGVVHKVRRGFLDVTVQINPSYKLRLIGAHLKSRLAVPEGEALLRRHEAHLLRQHVERILAEDRNVNLLLYGDFNATKNEPVIQEIMGENGSPNHMADLWLKDSIGDRWTYYWKAADIYSRVDFFFASPSLVPEIVQRKSSVFRSDEWEDASDHRPITATITPVNDQTVSNPNQPPTSSRASAARAVLK